MSDKARLRESEGELSKRHRLRLTPEGRYYVFSTDGEGG